MFGQTPEAERISRVNKGKQLLMPSVRTMNVSSLSHVSRAGSYIAKLMFRVVGACGLNTINIQVGPPLQNRSAISSFF